MRVSQVAVADYAFQLKNQMGLFSKTRELKGRFVRFALKPDFGPQLSPLFLDAPQLPYSTDLVNLPERLQAQSFSSGDALRIQAAVAFFRSQAQFAGLGLDGVRSHFLLNPSEALRQLSEGRFEPSSTIKIKVGSDLDELRTVCEELCSSDLDLRLRLDFNSSFEEAQVFQFFSRFSARAMAALDFVEDPLAPSLPAWAELVDLGVPVANDFAFAMDDVLEAPLADWPFRCVVVKPYARPVPQVLELVQAGFRVVFTHGMESPLGRRLAESMAVSSPGFSFEEIHGLSFLGDLVDPTFDLESMDWKPL